MDAAVLTALVREYCADLYARRTATRDRIAAQGIVELGHVLLGTRKGVRKVYVQVAVDVIFALAFAKMYTAECQPPPPMCSG